MARKYIDDGYLVIEDIFDPNTIENIKAEIPKFLDGTYQLKIHPFKKTQAS